MYNTVNEEKLELKYYEKLLLKKKKKIHMKTVKLNRERLTKSSSSFPIPIPVFAIIIQRQSLISTCLE